MSCRGTMYKKLRRKKTLCLLIFFLALTCLYKGSRTTGFVAQAIIWSFDSHLSDLAQKAIIRFAADKEYNSTASLCRILKKQFSYIADFTTHQENDKKLHIFVMGIIPS